MKKQTNKLLAIFLSTWLLFSATACNGCNGCNGLLGNTSSSGDSSGDDEYGGVTGEFDFNYTDVKIADNGSTDYTIIIPENANECITYAAEELETYLEESTAIDIRIETDAGKNLTTASKYISIGNTSLKETAGITVSFEEVNRDGYKIIRKDNSLFIASYEDRGTLYGVYELLNLIVGYEFYALNTYELDKKEIVYLPDLNYTDAPSFQGRSTDGTVDSSAELGSKLRLVTSAMGEPKYGGTNREQWMDMHCESYWHICSPTDYGTTHPEWFATRKVDEETGNEVATGGQWCLTNLELQAEVIKVLKQKILEHPKAIYVNIAEEDMSPYCNCVNCRNSNDTYGGVGGTQIRFINPIVEALEAWRLQTCPERDLRYVTFAYHSTIHAPVKLNENGETVPVDKSVVPHEKLYIRYAPIERCFLHGFYDKTCKTNESFAADWNNWCAITDRFMTWDYNVNYSLNGTYLHFFDRFSVLQKEYQEYARGGVVDSFVQNNSGSNLASMDDLSLYLNAKLMWDVNADVNKLIENFMNAYYGEGATKMKEYLTLMRSHIASIEVEHQTNGESYCMGMYGLHPKYFSVTTWKKTVLEKALSLLGEAELACENVADAGMRDMYKTHILKEKTCVQYMKLRYYSDLGYDTSASAYMNLINEWEKNMKTLNCNMLCEGSDGTFNKVLEVFKEAGGNS